MGPLPTPITIHIEPQTHLVAIATGVERGRIEGDGFTDHCFMPSHLYLRDFPDEGTIVAGGLQYLYYETLSLLQLLNY